MHLKDILRPAVEDCAPLVQTYIFQELHALKLYYYCLKKYVADEDFILLESDMDSLYFSISKENLENCVLGQN